MSTSLVTFPVARQRAPSWPRCGDRFECSLPFQHRGSAPSPRRRSRRKDRPGPSPDPPAFPVHTLTSRSCCAAVARIVHVVGDPPVPFEHVAGMFVHSGDGRVQRRPGRRWCPGRCARSSPRGRSLLAIWISPTQQGRGSCRCRPRAACPGACRPSVRPPPGKSRLTFDSQPGGEQSLERDPDGRTFDPAVGWVSLSIWSGWLAFRRRRSPGRSISAERPPGVVAGEGGGQLGDRARAQAGCLLGAQPLEDVRHQPAADAQAIPYLRLSSVGAGSREP